jgi:galactokinase/galacturonokinase
MKRIIYSPYRICPLGAHVDHQRGFVTGMTLDRGVEFCYSRNTNNLVSVSSHNFERKLSFFIDNIPIYEPDFWGNYMHGAALVLRDKYDIKYGLEGYVKGSLPIGGLSSSAAVLNAYLLALADVNNLKITQEEFISLGKHVENDYIGLKNGILDQATIVLSRDNHLLFLDTNNERYKHVEKPSNMLPFSIGVFYSGISTVLISTDYNNRVRECKIAAQLLSDYAGINSKKIDLVLRDIEEEVFLKHGHQLPLKYYKRAKHFYDENNRVHRGIDAWAKGDIITFGELMFQSGDSSVHYYESGSEELTFLYQIMKETEGIYGARFSGAGYRGCVIGLVNPSYEETIRQNVTQRYLKKNPQFLDVFQIDFCGTDGGVRII